MSDEPTNTTRSFAATVERLKSAQKPAARSAPAYSRYVNRRIGRYLAAACYLAGISPNGVTAISALFTFTSIALVVAFPPSLLLGILVCLGLLIGYAFDSADGQVSRLRGTTSTMPIALAIGFYRYDVAPVPWLLVPLGFSIVSGVLFFCMILTEQLRRQRGVQSLAVNASGQPSWLRAVLVAPMDYGVMCLSFALLGATPVFIVVYTVIAAATTLFLAMACVKWFRELRALGSPATAANPEVSL
jgi:hypothetical protein